MLPFLCSYTNAQLADTKMLVSKMLFKPQRLSYLSSTGERVCWAFNILVPFPPFHFHVFLCTLSQEICPSWPSWWHKLSWLFSTTFGVWLIFNGTLFFLQRHRDPPWNQSLHAAANQRLALLFICKVISTSLWCHNAFTIISINEFYWQ